MKPEDKKAMNEFIKKWSVLKTLVKEESGHNFRALVDRVWEGALAHRDAQPAAAINEQLLEAAKLAKRNIHSASLCCINSMSSRSEMLHLMEKAIGQLGAAIAAAEKARGRV